MTGNVAKLVATYAGRPVLMHRPALENLVQRIRTVDARAFEKPGRIEALFRKLSANRKPAMAMDDDDFGPPPPPLEEKLAYSPRYIGDADDAGYCWTLKDGIALMCADTPLSAHGDEFCGIAYHGYDTLLAGMREAASDARVKAIFLKMDSPGGVAAGGIVTLCKWMRENRAAAGGKPIWVYADMACSAAYWISAQADRIIGGSMGYVASIGCYMVHEDWSGAYEEHGIKVTEIVSDAKKTDGADWKPLSEGAYADLLADVTQIRDNFIADVTAGRSKLTSEKLLPMAAAAFMTDHADPARSGLALGFVDEIMGEEEAFLALRAKVSDPASTSPLTAPALAGRAAANKEQPMADKAPKTAAELAALKTEREGLEGQVTASQARIEEIKVEESGDEKKPAEGDDVDEEDETDEGGDKKITEIANSPEAAAEPQMAMAAIRDGLTLDQFKGQIAAKAASPKGGALASVLAGTPRLGLDAPSADAGGSALGNALVDSAKKRAGKRF